MTEINNKITQRKFNDYSDSRNVDNYIIDNELTVSITLNEYRQLVEDNAVSQSRIKAAEENRWSRGQEIEKLKEQNKELTALVNRYIKSYGMLEDEEEESGE